MGELIDIPAGYKKSKVGLIPTDWNIFRLSGILASAKLGGNYENSVSDYGLPLIKMGNILRGKVSIESLQYIPVGSEHHENDFLKEGDLLFNTRNTLELVGKVAIWRSELPKALYNSNLLRLEFDKNHVHSNYFMNYVMNSDYAISQLRRFATGTTSVAAIYSRDLNKLNVTLPSLPEQNKITKILSAWDKAITDNQLLLSEYITNRKGLEQQLLSGQIRFKDHVISNDKIKTKVGILPKNWELKSITEIVDRVKEKLNPEPETLYREIGIRSHCKGIFHKEEVTGESLGNKSVFWIQPDCFVVNIVFAWEHAIAKTTEAEVGMIASHRFPLYKPKADILDLDYLLYYFKTARGKHLLGLASPGGAGRNKTLGQTEFAKLKIPVPSLQEQKRIVSVLSESDKEIELLKQNITTLTEQKKGLMQKLLTGEIRVKVD
ncbi:restriction endonuclease subunit S [Flavivirga jejuensis]|uniref:Restriction endonuclease subunit S n=1 Tax=Flavivirga jejuensis TaxID=870487 RepID=A0ABT8WSX1_9FLAO|nr:restriction endonuclease subunit S [Flavivirga jejuensis]MDO5976260.1 restriction endonuclease subunit S [Flavivirga jejuensis]